MKHDLTIDGNDFVTDIRDGMAIDWDVPIEMDDGLVLRCDVYRPIEDGKYPVILSYGPYGKYLHFEDGYKTCWDRMAELHPDVTANSTNKYQQWEVVDPEKWVPEGYVCLRVDSRGCGRSPGYVECWGPRETRDLALCIEWAAKQAWSDGNIGLNGISYYAMNQWQVAAEQPPSLKAICIWEGAADFYRDMAYHGGIMCTFVRNWYDMQVKSVQYGLGSKGHRSRMTGDWVSGPDELSDEQRGAAREDLGQNIADHPLIDDYWRARNPDFSNIEVPMLSSANWGGNGLHPRGNFEGYYQSASKNKWLEVHGIEHWTEFYTDYGREIQLAFFDHFLKGEKNGWDKRPKLQLQIRHPGEKFVERFEQEWPLKRTKWTKFYLHPASHRLLEEPVKNPNTRSYRGFSDGITFISHPFEQETEITGPLASKLFVSSSTTDADLFVIFRVFTPDLKEVVFQGALDPHTPVAQGWLRASHRKLDKKLSEPWRPWHTHDEKQPLNPGEVYELDIEVWPTCIVVPAGHRIAYTVRGTDYVYPGGTDSGLSNMKNAFTGVGPFLHNDPADRPSEIFDGEVTLHFGGDYQPYVLVPVIPNER
jgi:predicted acyl esterase